MPQETSLPADEVSPPQIAKGEINFLEALEKRTQDVMLTPSHRAIAEALQSHDLVFVVGPAGTGKTYTTVNLAIAAKRAKAYREIIVSRPMVEAGRRLGYLPGTVDKKMAPFTRPLKDAFDKINDADRKTGIGTGAMQTVPLEHMRGLTFTDSFVILDEAQNCTLPQLMLALTRLGRGSKMVITGDPDQSDLAPGQSGLAKTIKCLENLPGVAVVRMTEKDNLRHPLVAQISTAMALYVREDSPSHSAPVKPGASRKRRGSRISHENDQPGSMH